MTVYSYSSFHHPTDDMVFLLCCHKPEKRRNRGKSFHYGTSRRLCLGVREGSFPKLHHADTGRCSCGQPHPLVRHHRCCQPCFHAASSISSKACYLSCLPPHSIRKRRRHLIGYELLLLHSGYVRYCYHLLKEAHIFIWRRRKK